MHTTLNKNIHSKLILLNTVFLRSSTWIVPGPGQISPMRRSRSTEFWNLATPLTLLLLKCTHQLTSGTWSYLMACRSVERVVCSAKFLQDKRFRPVYVTMRWPWNDSLRNCQALRQYPAILTQNQKSPGNWFRLIRWWYSNIIQFIFECLYFCARLPFVSFFAFATSSEILFG